MEVPTLLQCCSELAIQMSLPWRKLPSPIQEIIKAHCLTIGIVNHEEFRQEVIAKVVIKSPRSPAPEEALQYPRGVCILPGTRIIAVLDGFYAHGGKLLFFDMDSGKFIRSFFGKNRKGLAPMISFSSQNYVSADYKHIAISDGSSGDSAVYIVDRTTGKHVVTHRATRRADIFNGLSFLNAASGKVVVSTSGETAAPEKNRIIILSPQGKELQCMGHREDGTSYFSGRSDGLCVHPKNRIACCDWEANEVHVFDLQTGKKLFSFGDKSNCHGPSDVACDGAGYFFVTAYNKNCISCFDSNGEFQYSWTAKSQMNSPCSIAISARGEIVVSERMGHIVCVYGGKK